MARGDDTFRTQGTVVETLRNAEFRVALDSGLEIVARASGKMRRGRGIRIIPGDKVEVEVSAYDPTKAAS
jgi:translation initiation factor IF-1